MGRKGAFTPLTERTKKKKKKTESSARAQRIGDLATHEPPRDPAAAVDKIVARAEPRVERAAHRARRDVRRVLVLLVKRHKCHAVALDGRTAEPTPARAPLGYRIAIYAPLPPSPHVRAEVWHPVDRHHHGGREKLVHAPAILGHVAVGARGNHIVGHVALFVIDAIKARHPATEHRATPTIGTTVEEQPAGPFGAQHELVAALRRRPARDSVSDERWPSEAACGGGGSTCADASRFQHEGTKKSEN